MPSLGSVPGSVGETSTLAIFIGGFFLLLTRTAAPGGSSWVYFLGMAVHVDSASIWIGSDTNPMFAAALALAPGFGRFRVWHDLHGDGPGLGLHDQHGQVVLRRLDRGDGQS